MTGQLILTAYTYDQGLNAINTAFSGTANFNILLLDGNFSGGTNGGKIYSGATDLNNIFLTYSAATYIWSSSTGNYSIRANNPTLNVASDDYAFAWGSGNTASSTGATAFGMGNVASGVAATAFGNGCLAQGVAAIAAVFKSNAKGPRSIAIGAAAISEGTDSVSIGDSTSATTTGSFAIGKATLSSAQQSFAGGLSAQSTNGAQAFAFGNDVRSTGEQSAAFGRETMITGAQSFGAGYLNSALTYNAAVFGFSNLVEGAYSFASGVYTHVPGVNSFALGRGLNDTNRLRVGADYSYNFSTVNIPWTGGADANYSVILGGANVDILSVAERAIVLGMDSFVASNSATTYVDNFYVNGYMDFNSGATLPSPKAGRVFFSGSPLFRLMLNTGGTAADWIVL